MIRRLACGMAVGVLCAFPALAGYVDSQPKSSPVYKAAKTVAQSGCAIDAMDWRDLIISLGGRESDAVWHISQMTSAGEAVIVNSATLQLKGVFGC